MSVSPTTTIAVDAPEQGSGGMPRNPSRFQVNRVDGASDSPDATPSPTPDVPDEGTLANNNAATNNKDTVEVLVQQGKQVQFSVGVKPENESGEQTMEGGQNMGTINYGTSNLKSFRNVNTVERLPHQDHYRNIMSVEGAMAVRPTLAELHEENDMKPTSGGEIIDMKHFTIQDVRRHFFYYLLYTSILKLPIALQRGFYVFA